jgi:hypothetical protein
VDLTGRKVNTYLMTCVSLVALLPTLALAEKLSIPPSSMLNEMEVQGAPLEDAINPIVPLTFDDIGNVPVGQLLDIAQQPVHDLATFTRSAKDAEIYRTIAPRCRSEDKRRVGFRLSRKFFW